MVEQNVQTGQETQAPPATEQGQAESPATQPQPADLQGWMQKKGFKSETDVAKSYDEAQAALTRVAQEKAQLEQALRDLSQVTPPQQPQQQAPDFFDDPEGNVKRIVEGTTSRIFQTYQAQQAIETVRAENVEKFEQLRPIMQQIYQEKPWLNNQGAVGLRAAMREAEQRRVNYIGMLRKELFSDTSGTPEQTSTQEDAIRQKLLAEIQRNQGATIPQGGSRSITADSSKKQREARDKGDVDGVLDEMFKTFKT